MSSTAFFNAVQYAILIYFVMMNTTYFTFSIVAFFDLLSFDRRSRRRGVGDVLSGSTIRPISIIVPAFNERATIISSVNSMIEVAYPEFEVIVVNDGSEDDTLERMREAFSLFPVTDTTRPHLKTSRVIHIYRSLNHPNLIVVERSAGARATPSTPESTYRITHSSAAWTLTRCSTLMLCSESRGRSSKTIASLLRAGSSVF